MAKPHITRTLGPIHFEDLDPHRFEDLIRQLIYDFKQWQSIESTGRGGGDDGFDVRAFEVAEPLGAPADDDEIGDNAPHPMDGNLWMIQCKREKSLGPKRVEDIIAESVDAHNPPYGYILAAPAHFSKSAHDKFRNELRSRGVMEFYLWGAGELEDMLYQPKNDHILFGFFGISLTARKRSRSSRIRSTVGAKNKLLRIFGDNPSFEPILVRDLNDEHYPYDDEYSDFEKNPRWKMFNVVDFHPLGIVVTISEYYAYYDHNSGAWDYAKAVNIARPVDSGSFQQRDADTEELKISVKGFWELLPIKQQATFVRRGLIKFESISFIDEKGDRSNQCPHIFVSFEGNRGPFFGFFNFIEIGDQYHESVSDGNRKNIFPENFSKPTFGKIYTENPIEIDNRTRTILENSWTSKITLYDADGRYSFLKPTDVVIIHNTKNRDGKEVFLKITNIRSTSSKELLDTHSDGAHIIDQIESQIARKLKSKETIQVLESTVIHGWQIEQNRPVV
ncbi:restriction endonuclease [Burkholderia cenocepacia]|uniref:restriction endonuclease n=1 Tax=Burkholderia cenocepacia TaxID=95486 RepID=UPI001F426A11|nr:restriction endonuclease [Burkholderia cenocepacia]UJH74391.1 restriction endonuclease [Burkholderia cenocepacia]